jgi:predicted nucleic acid-binding protein
MVTYYLDTSAALKQYVNEVGSEWQKHTLSRDTVIVATQLLIVEVASALNRRVREGTVEHHDYARLSGRFRDDCRDVYQLVILDDAIVDVAYALLERHSLRAYDAVHLATAITVNRWLVEAGEAALTFLCADNHLLAAASAEGLAVDNPNDHP